MAKTAPLHGRAKRLARIRGDIHPLAPQKTLREGASVPESFIDSKRDRRTIKHSTFVNKIQKSAPKSAASSRKARRKPNKRLVATLESLADALPEVAEGDRLNEGKVRHKSLSSRPGALKRKEKVVKGEMERFGENMAKLVGSGEAAKKKKKGEEVQASSTETKEQGKD